MSQSSTNTSPHSSITCSCPPKKFLKKGEGLKRFAAYRPPLPMTASKLGRRQTFVKFKLHEDTKINQPSFIPPEILNDESINLSTEIPKIAPPKIMHTPIRPNRLALGALRPTAFNVHDYDSDENMFATPLSYPRGHENGSSTELISSKQSQSGPIDKVPQALLEKNLSRKIATITPKGPSKMISFNGFRKPKTPSPRSTPPPVAQPVKENFVRESIKPAPVAILKGPTRRYNLRGSRKPAADEDNGDDACIKDTLKREPRRTKRQIKAIVERHISPPSKQCVQQQECVVEIPQLSESQIKGNIDNLLHRIEKKKETLEEGCTQAIHPIKGPSLRVSDLSSPSPGNCISALGQQIQQIQSTVNELKERMKNCRCGNLLSPSEAPSKRPTRKTTRSKANEQTRPSAYADNSTPKILSCLVDEVSQLKARLDEMSLRPSTLTGNKIS